MDEAEELVGECIDPLTEAIDDELLAADHQVSSSED